MNPIDALIEIGAAVSSQRPYRAAILLKEHESKSYPLNLALSVSQLNQLLTFLQSTPQLRSLISAKIEASAQGTGRLTISTSSLVGFSACGQGQERLFVRVQPKIGPRRMLDLCIAAERLPKWVSEITVDPDEDSTLSEWTIRAFAMALDQLLRTGGVRSTHERVSETLRNRVRGKLCVHGFLGSLSRGRPDQLPCEFSALRADNPQNRALRWTIRIALQTLDYFSNVGALTAALRRADRYFTDVPLEPPKIDVERLALTLPPNLRHYGQALRIAGALLKGINLSAHPGWAAAPSLAIDMNALYEEAFYKISRSLRPDIQRKPTWNLMLRQMPHNHIVKSLRLQPDIFLPQDSLGSAAVVDTKWKRAFGLRDEEQADDWADGKSLLSPRTSDFYQMIAYGMDALRTTKAADRCICAMIYPCLGNTSDVFHELRLTNSSVFVIVMGWNLGSELWNSTELIWQNIDSLRRTPPEVSHTADSSLH